MTNHTPARVPDPILANRSLTIRKNSYTTYADFGVGWNIGPVTLTGDPLLEKLEMVGVNLLDIHRI